MSIHDWTIGEMLAQQDEALSYCEGAVVPAYLDQTVLSILREQVRACPDIYAVQDDHQTFTYRQLDEYSDCLAAYLCQQGIQPHERVGLYLERSALQIIIIFAVMKVGAAYIPFDRRWPMNKIDEFCSQFDVAFALTDIQNTQFKSAQTLFLKPEYFKKVDVQVIGYEYRVLPSDIAYMIFTSGSTGVQKLVPIQHEGLANLGKDSRIFNLKVGQRVLQFAPLSFDASVYEWLIALCAGATLCIIQSEQDLAGVALANYIQSCKIHLAILPPSILATLSADQVDCLEVLILGGESPNLRMLQKWLGLVTLYNAYGPSETTICCCLTKYTKNLPANIIGNPVANTRIYLLEPHSTQCVSQGNVGEICVSGVGVSPGYIGMHDVKGSFIDHPFADSTESHHAILYRTGDLARMLENGDLEFIGRMDNQVKISGNRIHLDYIKSVVDQSKWVRDSAIFIAAPYEKQVICAAVLSDDPEFNLDQLKKELQTQLPSHMLPKFWLHMTAFPITLNGKVDQAQLRREIEKEQECVPALVQENGEKELDLIQAELASIWAKVFRKEGGVPFDKSFMELGGDSLTAIQLTGEMSQYFKLELDTLLLFEYENINAFADYIGKRCVEDRSINEAMRVAFASAYKIPLDERQLFLYKKFTHDEQFRNILLMQYELKAALSKKVFRQACQHLVDQCDILRANLLVEEDIPILNIHAVQSVELLEYDLRGQASSRHLESIQDIYNDFLKQPLDIEQDPLIKFILIQTGDKNYKLLIYLYHLLGDLQSMDMIIQNIAAYYETLYQGQALEVNLKKPFKEHWDYEQSYLESPKLQEDVQFWAHHLSGSQRLLALPQFTHESRKTDELYFDLSSYIDQIAKLAQKVNVTPYVVLFSVFQYAISLGFSQHSFGVGIPVSKRTHSFYDDRIGPFNTRVPFMCDLSDQADLLSVIQATHEQLNAIRAHVHVPPSQFKKLLQNEPAYHIIFDYEQGLDLNNKLLSLNRESIPDEEAMSHLLFARVHQYLDQAYIKFRYKKEEMPEPALQQMIVALEQILTGIGHE